MPVSVSELHFYPVKSCAGVALSVARLGPRGIEGDRSYMIVDAEGRFVTQRERPRLALIAPRLHDGCLHLEAPGMPSLEVPVIGGEEQRNVVVWSDIVEADDQGDEAARWLSEFLGVAYRLVRMPDDRARESGPVRGRPASSDDSGTSFADAYSLLVTSASSLDDLNARIETPLPMNRFRPNIVVRNAMAFAEDRWVRVRVGAVEMTVAKPCVRCVTTAVDQATGKRGIEPLRTLATFRRDDDGGVTFGQNLVYVRDGDIAVGDPVLVLE